MITLLRMGTHMTGDCQNVWDFKVGVGHVDVTVVYTHATIKGKKLVRNKRDLMVQFWKLCE